MNKKRHINFYIIICIIIFFTISIPIRVQGAGAMDSNPNVQLPTGSQGELRPGEENQKNQEKKKEEQKKEEIKKQTEWSDEEKKKMTSEQIVSYIKENYAIKDGVAQGDIGNINESKEVKEAWIETMRKDGHIADDGSKDGAILSQLEDRTYGVEKIYKQPEKDPNTDPENASSSIDDMINDAKSFISQGKIKYANDGDKSLKNVSNTVYNILLVVGTSIAVIMGAILGIKLMASGVEEKAEVKKLLIPYVVGCIVIFGGFGIWKLAVTILQGI